MVNINNPLAGKNVTGLSGKNIYQMTQRIVQMTQAYGNAQLTNGNGTNFWDQMVATAVLVASMSRVCTHVNFHTEVLNTNEYKCDKFFSPINLE